MTSHASEHVGLVLRQLGPLRLHHDVQQLVLQADHGDHEVQQRHLDSDLGQVVRVAELGGEVELEVLAKETGAGLSLRWKGGM